MRGQWLKPLPPALFATTVVGGAAFFAGALATTWPVFAWQTCGRCLASKHFEAALGAAVHSSEMAVSSAIGTLAGAAPEASGGAPAANAGSAGSAPKGLTG